MSYIAWLRGLIGHQKTVLVFASVILRDDQGNIVLQRRTDFDIWGLPGGILEPGESIVDCARREALEETGLSAAGLECVGVYTDPAYDTVYPNGDQVQQYTVCFQGQISAGEFYVDGIETSELRFFAPQDLPLQEMALFYVHMLQDALGGAPHKSGPAFSPAWRFPNLQDVFPLVRPLIGNSHYIGAGAMAAVVNDRNQILMVQRLDDGEWSLPGGYTMLGENAAHTAIRETEEETEMPIEIERLLGVSSQTYAWTYPNGDKTQAVISIFRAHPLGSVLRPDRVETGQTAWMDPDQVLALNGHPILKRIHSAVIQNLHQGWFVLTDHD